MFRLSTTIIILFLTSTLFANASIAHSQYTKVSNIVKQQQYLAQQILKDYVSFQKDRKNIQKRNKMRKSIQLFSSNQKKLITNKKNTQLINQKLIKVNEFWDVAYNLAEKEELSKLVTQSMQRISKKMKEVSKLYSIAYH